MWDPRRKESEAQTCFRLPGPKLGSSIFQWHPKLGGCVSESPTGLLNEYRFPGLIPDLLNEFLLVVPGFLYFLNVSLTTWWVVCILEHGEATFL